MEIKLFEYLLAVQEFRVTLLLRVARERYVARYQLEQNTFATKYTYVETKRWSLDGCTFTFHRFSHPLRANLFKCV